MKWIATGLVLSTVMVIDFFANYYDMEDSDGWDMTASIVFVAVMLFWAVWTFTDNG